MRRGPIVAWLLSIAAVACGEPNRLPATAPSGSAGTGGSVGGASAGGTGAAGTGGASAGAIQYAGTDVNPVNSGDGVVFRRIDVRNTLCVLVWAFILPGGQVQPPITALPT